ncbi:MAG: DUF418 domain-containing protein [Caulobacter sp.]|nr:DUF418 domain-containing protein [Caulobacter sp.]
MSSQDRHISIDAVRGVAVLGILLMNIVGMGMPTFAYITPAYYGGHEGANLWAWAINYVVADGKMRGLFTMLFGASMMLIADRAEGRVPGPASIHYRRVFWLFVFGMIHAYFLFFGDILVTYALAGALVFMVRRWSPKLLILIGAIGLALLAAKGLFDGAHLAQLREAAQAPDASEAIRKAWSEEGFLLNPPASFGEGELAAYRGGFLDALKARAFVAVLMQTVFLISSSLPEAIAQMMIGVGLYRLGFFTLGWSSRAYAGMAALGWGVGMPVTGWLAWRIAQSGFEPLVLHDLGYWGALPRPFIALAHASGVLLLVRSGALGWLVNRLAAAGRMALSNYLGTSIITSFVFCGYGLGLYGRLQRFELYYVVAAIWLLILLWSLPWMRRFHYGPFEWLWRSLVRWKPQPFAKRGETKPSA